ncbi:hypothetical protein HY625_02880 [Candidatus Uhrbacteria bacterium]|nr:hypothetical protein [Candidatus Uhrbacteria bacterium]
MLTIPQQFTETVQRAKRILIAFRKNGDGDAIASALAVAHLITTMGKSEVSIVSQDFVLPKNIAFLPRAKEIVASLSGLRKFTIELDAKNVKLKDFSYDLTDGKLKIFLTPEEGFFRAEDMTYAASPFAYDCIITVNTPDLASLGDVYTKHAEFFYATPIINIDHDIANESYGQINLIDPTATATGEALFEAILSLGSHFIDKTLATYLLTAIIAETRSFRSPRITPKTLQMTGELIAHGADRDNIMQNLYRTRSVGTLKLWGRVLTRLEHDAAIGFAWSSLTAEDFERTGATPEQLPDIVEDLLQNAPTVKTTLLLYEEVTKDGIVVNASGDRPVAGVLCTTAPYSALALCSNFKPSGSKERAYFRLPTHSLREAEKEVVEKIKAQLAPIQ